MKSAGGLRAGLAASMLLAALSPAFAQMDSASPASANYHDLDQSPGPFVAATPAQKRAQVLEDAIGANWISFRIALSMPDDPGQREGFLGDLQGAASPDAVRAYLDALVPVYTAAVALIDKGTATATDDDLARFSADLAKMRTAEVKVSYDNPDPDAAELNNDSLKPVFDTKGKHVISDLTKLGQAHATALGGASPEAFKAEQDKLLDSRLKDILAKSRKTERADQEELKNKLRPLVQREVNGALWQYREINALITVGLDQPDRGAMDVFNSVLDELKADLADERRAQ